MAILAQIVNLLITEAPEIQAFILSIVQMIKDQREGKITAQQATDNAHAALAQLLGRQADPAAQDASDLAAVTAEAEAKFKP